MHLSTTKPAMLHGNSLCCRCNLASVSECWFTCILFFARDPQQTQQITGRAFQMSFHLNWQIDDGILNSKSWCVLKSRNTGGGPVQGFRCCFTEGLNQSLWHRLYNRSMTWFQMPCYRRAAKKSNLIQLIRLAPREHGSRNAMGPIHVHKIAGSHCNYSGLLIFRGKKSKISQDFQGQIRGKIGRFRGRKVNICRKIGPIRGILA